MNFKKTLLWIAAFLLTIFVAGYQRTTGPTYPKSYECTIDDEVIEFKLPRSQNGIEDALIILDIKNAEVNGKIYYKRFNTSDSFDTLKLYRENNQLIAWLPAQPVAGKLEYGLILENVRHETLFQTPENIVIRFKDKVPAYVLIPHILFIFAAMLLSNLTGFYAISGFPSYRFYTGLTLVLFLIGGMIMGPVVQKYAFGEFWTGFPLGKDLTDNKALIAFVFWIIAWLGNRKDTHRKYLVIIAFAVYLAISLIPHSLMGSELDYESGEIKTGVIFLSQWI